MISCTEFIPAYSEGFKFIDKKKGRREVERFWRYLSDLYVKDRLGRLVAEEGLEGCFTYWSQALNEEAADFRMVFNGIKGEFRSEMRRCPSKGMLNSLKYMEPYRFYCDHCPALYGPVLQKYGFKYEKDMSKVDKASCSGVIKAG
jgi:hypothetical protein